jgi:colicin import membrane protein
MSSTLDLSSSQPQEPMNRFIGYSLVAHVLIFAIFAVKAAFFKGEPIVFESAIKVDLVGLPDKVTAPPLPEAVSPAPSTAATPAPQVETKIEPALPTPKLAQKEKKVDIDTEAINLDVTKRKQSAALERLKRLSALEAIEKEVSEENKKKALDKLKQIKGNVLSNGSELSGVTRLQHDNYIAVVEHHVRQNWALPEWLARKNLKAQVRVRFDENGNIISRDIFKSSGNPSFDEVVLNTVEKSSPVPAPPAKFARILSVEGILLGFPE